MKRRGRKAEQRDRDIADELDWHVRMATRERVDQGDGPDEARRDAEREIGDRRALEATMRNLWDENPGRPSVTRRVRRGAVGVVVAAGLMVSAAVGGQRLSTWVIGLLREVTARLSPEQLSVLTLAIACLMVLVLVTVCANLANRTQDRHRDEVLKRSLSRVRTAHVWYPTAPKRTGG